MAMETTSVRNELLSSSRRSRSAALMLVLFLIGIVVVFRNEISAPLTELWRATLGPLVVQDWQSDRRLIAPPGDRIAAQEIAQAEAGGEIRSDQATQSGPATTVPVMLAEDFHPVSFEIAAASLPLTLDDDLVAVWSSGDRRHGTFQFATGVSYDFELFAVRDDLLLFVDTNRNGDFSDDGEPYRSPADAFEVTVEFPMTDVSGLNDSGTYQLWVYRTPEGGLRQVALTQFAGEVSLADRRYKAYVVENTSIDGNYANEGVYIDVNGDGRIHPAREYFASGAALNISGQPFELVVKQ